MLAQLRVCFLHCEVLDTVTNYKKNSSSLFHLKVHVLSTKLVSRCTFSHVLEGGGRGGEWGLRSHPPHAFAGQDNMFIRSLCRGIPELTSG